MYATASLTTLRSIAVVAAGLAGAASPPGAPPGCFTGGFSGSGAGLGAGSGSPPIETGVAAPKFVAGAIAAT